MPNQKIYSGKAKDLYSTEDENVIVAQYKDQATMLNGARKEEVLGKGKLNNQISSLIFRQLNKAGIKTHFIKQLSETEQSNVKLAIIPLEVVLRNVVAGSFAKRFGLEEGVKLSKPIVEFYYKNDDLDDPFINDEHALFLKVASAEELAFLKAQARQINIILQDLFARIGLTLIDFKLEFGRNQAGEIILADEVSPDTCRLWDTDGNHMDKDVFRRNLGSITDVYQVVLEKLQGLEENE
ncbi:phosphoribosylaminoimidazolesuccinocarboxamide synthase [Streptococcus merionis]|uniref:Phosphoribosylaminoimidazole-succinocarboxamide synthase n=1 Tax=Streptococcus merionis TaxID=400065 RepID=A0A239T006_9STRE|nr:phosphoribosylaminoimidazolesuccinocarboxamide synthase [Streptococcus merionis]SNU90829.1 phosphoribosylaminoimidazolesuccinocarboxamide synthase [Streptococcus merionis]